MHPIDWTIVGAYLSWVLYDGLRRSKDTHAVEGYFLASRSLPWWAVGLSVMATQMSAITLVGTTGQGYSDGMRFVQFYFGLPVAMIILSVTLVPFFYRAKVFTAYEYLERRFDAKTRMLAGLLFLVSRGLAVGVIISAPAVVLSIVLEWNLAVTAVAIGLPTTLYTMFGGVQAVTWADVKQMVVIVGAVSAAVAALILGLPEGIGLGEALHVAGSTGRLETIDFSFDLGETYTFWSGLFGGLVLMLGYFGCDQSQVQRYLTARSVDAGRRALLMSAFWKIPLQALILLTGVLVFIFYLFHEPPMLFNSTHANQMRSGGQGSEYASLETEFHDAFEQRREAADRMIDARRNGGSAEIAATREEFAATQARLEEVRVSAVGLVQQVSGDNTYTDVNYVFPTFVTSRLPIGLVGLLIAAVFAAAMSSIAAELNALSATTVMDFYRRHLRTEASDRHYLFVSKLTTAFWGVFATVFALYAANLGSLIEVVNRVGSYFYGSLLGVFVLAIGFRRASANGAFWGLLAGMVVVGLVEVNSDISYIWYNVVGSVAVVVAGLTVSAFQSVHDT
ncbi:MAG: sodium:solute symporter [Acidobacteria bacterium]|nr:sodium:solute symporter [Acidobacteriota bacterium]